MRKCWVGAGTWQAPKNWLLSSPRSLAEPDRRERHVSGQAQLPLLLPAFLGACCPYQGCFRPPKGKDHKP